MWLIWVMLYFISLYILGITAQFSEPTMDTKCLIYTNTNHIISLWNKIQAVKWVLRTVCWAVGLELGKNRLLLAHHGLSCFQDVLWLQHGHVPSDLKWADAVCQMVGENTTNEEGAKWSCIILIWVASEGSVYNVYSSIHWLTLAILSLCSWLPQSMRWTAAQASFCTGGRWETEG